MRPARARDSDPTVEVPDQLLPARIVAKPHRTVSCRGGPSGTAHDRGRRAVARGRVRPAGVGRRITDRPDPRVSARDRTTARARVRDHARTAGSPGRGCRDNPVRAGGAQRDHHGRQAIVLNPLRTTTSSDTTLVRVDSKTLLARHVLPARRARNDQHGRPRDHDRDRRTGRRTDQAVPVKAARGFGRWVPIRGLPPDPHPGSRFPRPSSSDPMRSSWRAGARLKRPLPRADRHDGCS